MTFCAFSDIRMPVVEPDAPRSGLTKVPEVAFGFWLIKILATTLGETGGDAFSMSLKFGYAISSLIFIAAFAGFASAQIRARRFHPFLYWATVIATTTAGTTIADFADRSLGIGYAGGSILLAALLMASFVIWKRNAGSVAVSAVSTPRIEAFYWITVLFSQTLGTALGDWMADTNGMGYEKGALIFGTGLLLVLALYLFTQFSRTALFWSAFVLTRPLGATLGDWLDKPAAQGGMEISRFTASGILAGAIILCLLLLPQRPTPNAAKT